MTGWVLKWVEVCAIRHYDLRFLLFVLHQKTSGMLLSVEGMGYTRLSLDVRRLTVGTRLLTGHSLTLSCYHHYYLFNTTIKNWKIIYMHEYINRSVVKLSFTIRPLHGTWVDLAWNSPLPKIQILSSPKSVHPFFNQLVINFHIGYRQATWNRHLMPSTIKDLSTFWIRLEAFSLAVTVHLTLAQDFHFK